ncbi:MAG: hypothetical protein AAGB00_11795, partial [Planctomycetota bacterium]
MALRSSPVGPEWRRRALGALLAVVLGLAESVDAAEQATEDQAALAADLTAAGEAFTPALAERLESARRDLAAAAAALERALVPGSPRGEAWKAYLFWPAFQRQLAPGAALEFTALRATLDRLTNGERGLERPEFQAVAAAIRRLIAIGRIERVRDPQAYLAQQAERLAMLLGRDPTASDPRASYQIEQRLALFDDLRLMPDVGARLEGRLVHLNIHGDASERLLDLLARRPVGDTRPIDDTILGTQITGAGITTGQISLDLIPSGRVARLRFLLAGNVASETCGVNGPVSIRSRGDTAFRGAKTVDVTDDAFTVLAADLTATTASRTRSISKRGSRLGKRIVEAIAHRKVEEARAQANAIASQRADDQITGEFDSQVLDEVREARRQYDDLLMRPLARRAARPRRIAMSTADERLFVSAALASPRQLGAATPPPAPLPGDLSLRVHQSALNNLADAFLGGATIRQRTADGPIEIDAVLPHQLRKELALRPDYRKPAGAPFRPWSVTLRRERPISFTVDSGLLTALVHATSIESGRDRYAGWDIQIVHRLARDGVGWCAERVGELDVLPTSFDPAVPGARIGTRQRALRRNLAKQLTARLEAQPGVDRRPRIGPFRLDRLSKPGLNRLVVQAASLAGG